MKKKEMQPETFVSGLYKVCIWERQRCWLNGVNLRMLVINHL